MLGSVLIPAHNEERVLAATLAELLAGLAPDVVVIVACNGCTDKTAQVARRFAPRIHVLDIAEPSKVAALQAAEATDPPFPRIYLDADVRLSGADAERLLGALANGAPAAEPRAVIDLSESGVLVRAFYAVWTALHGREPGDVGCGLYALSRAGRGRFGDFPRVIADDGFVRAHFARGEIHCVEEAESVVRAPRRVRDLIAIKTRSRLGGMELAQRFPDLWAKKRASAASLATKASTLAPRLWPLVPVYLAVQILARARARRFARDTTRYRWERDESSRR